MKKLTDFFKWCFFFTAFVFSNNCFGISSDTIPPRHKVSLPEAHIGNLEIDTKLLDSYGRLPENIRQFYLDARFVFSGNPEADFTNSGITEAARNHNMLLMGGPMLGNLSDDGVVIWLRPSTEKPLVVKVTKSKGRDEKSFKKDAVRPGVVQRIVLNGLTPDTKYEYGVYIDNHRIAKGSFTTTPVSGEKGIFRLAFGSCFQIGRAHV